ncbi:MAG TPA: glycogen/starch/alpha-glucan phosphorylase, partial [Spirochaetota bacterium]|nr:glycogen/starch/alpha-glucan phosphorylase [Spirochaetota bacterium]
MQNNEGLKKSLTQEVNEFQKTDPESIKKSITTHLEYSLAKDEYTATQRDLYESIALTTRDRLVDRWIKTQQSYYDNDVKRVYYFSMEYLVGRTLGNSLVNLGLYENSQQAVKELGYKLEDLREAEWDAGLGNGGLGRLAACFLDSMATLAYPAYGYGLRYEFGIFHQVIKDGYQVELPDSWLRYGNPWEIARPEFLFPVNFYGHVEEYRDENGKPRKRWSNPSQIIAMAYDTPVPGYMN